MSLLLVVGGVRVGDGVGASVGGGGGGGGVGGGGRRGGIVSCFASVIFVAVNLLLLSLLLWWLFLLLLLLLLLLRWTADSVKRQIPGSKNATRLKMQTLPGKVIGRILLSRNQLLRVEKLAIGASANFVHHLGCPKNLWGYAVCWWILENM